jgi:type I protein arginine methyltransferase
MTHLAPETVLIRAPEIRLKLSNRRAVEIEVGDLTVVTSEQALAILQTFAHPTSVGEALTRVGARTPEEWIEASTCILHLHESGLLHDLSAPAAYVDTLAYDAAPIHVQMLNDRRRTASFLRAIREVVRPNDVVVDIGTGTGVLAIAAAKAGARHVYAIEEGSIGESAKEMFAANGLSDRITLISGKSIRVELPERGNVLVSETLGNDIFDENILEMTRDARARLLQPRARLVPARLRVFALPLDVPRDEIAQQSFVPENLASWRSLYEIDFDALARRPHGHPFIFRTAQQTRDWRRLAPPILLAEIDLSTVDRTDLNVLAHSTLETSGLLSGVLVYFEAELAPNVVLSIHPDEDGLDHWRRKVWLLPDPIEARAGASIAVRYSFCGKSHLTVHTAAP